ncbi:MAG TPA: ferritin [Candidatus Methanomethylophilaceae archaeon]|nr:ferritin [Candidatus Methanomethylophilaceae archaeon]
MISKKVAEAINDQINMEYYSAFLYLDMSSSMDDKGFRGYASWLFLQYKEELEHAEKFIAYLQSRGEQPNLMKIDAPEEVPNVPLIVAEAAYGHEVKVSRSIDKIYALACKEQDFATASFLKWFIDEQVEEEETTSEIVDLFKLAGEGVGALFSIDQKLGSRTPE